MWISNFYFPVKQLTTETDNRAWYEKLEDYEGEFEFVEEDGEDGERGKKICVIQVLSELILIWKGAEIGQFLDVSVPLYFPWSCGPWTWNSILHFK
jgi:hypothetical protein